MRVSLATAIFASLIGSSLTNAAAQSQTAPHNASKSSDAQKSAQDEIVITGSRLSQPIVNLTSVAEAHIESQRSATTLDLLRQVPGVSATQPGGPGGVTEVFLRGAESNFATVLIDGVKVNDSSNTRGGGYDFSTLNPDEIEAIEVARGPLSAVHGSDAMSGVINIRTRRPADELSVLARGEVGADDYRRAFGSLSGPLNANFRAGLKASYADFGEPVEGSTQELTTVQGDIDASPSVSANIRAGLRYVERDRTSFPDASGGPLFAVSREVERAEAKETSAWTQVRYDVSSAWRIDTVASYYGRKEDVNTPAVAPGVFDPVPASVSDTHFKRGQLTVNNIVQFDSSLEVGGGVDLQYEAGERDGSLDVGILLPSDFDLNRFIGAGFVEARYAAESGLQVYGAGRVEKAEDDKTRASGRVAVQYRTHPDDVLLRASVGNGYKRPSFYALGDTLIGNPDLKMETSQTVELSAEKTFAEGWLTTGLSVFRSRYSDLIDFDFATFRLVNRSEAQIDGVELTATLNPLESLSVTMHGTFSSIELDGQENVLLYRPENYGGIRLDWRPTELWSFQAHAQFVGQRAGSSVPTGQVEMESYERLDLSASRKIGAYATVFAAVDNLFDDKHQQAVGFPDPGLQGRVGAAFSF